MVTVILLNMEVTGRAIKGINSLNQGNVMHIWFLEKDNDDHEEDTGLFTVFIVVVYINVIIGLLTVVLVHI